MATQPIFGDRFFEDVVPNRPGLLTAKDVARMLAVSEKAIYKWVSKGLGPPHIKLGSALRFRPAALREWLKNREYPGR